MRLAIRGRTNGRAHQNPRGARGGWEACGGRPPKRVRQGAGFRNFPGPTGSLLRRGRGGGSTDRGVTGAPPRRRLRMFGFRGWRVGPANGCRQRAKPRPSPTPTARPRTVAPESPCGTTTDPFPTRRTDRSMPIPSPPTPPNEGRDVRTRHRGTKTRWGSARPRTTTIQKERGERPSREFADGGRKPASVLGTGNQPNRLGSSSENNRLPRTK